MKFSLTAAKLLTNKYMMLIADTNRVVQSVRKDFEHTGYPDEIYDITRELYIHKSYSTPNKVPRILVWQLLNMPNYKSISLEYNFVEMACSDLYSKLKFDYKANYPCGRWDDVDQIRTVSCEELSNNDVRYYETYRIDVDYAETHFEIRMRTDGIVYTIEIELNNIHLYLHVLQPVLTYIDYDIKRITMELAALPGKLGIIKAADEMLTDPNKYQQVVDRLVGKL